MPLFGSMAGIDNVLHPLPILWHDGAGHLDQWQFQILFLYSLNNKMFIICNAHAFFNVLSFQTN